MSAKTEEKQVYEVVVFRADNNHISIMQTINFDEAVESWKSTTENWESSIKAKKPFKLMSPVVTSFDPGMIREIAVRPLAKVQESKYDNPYQQKMMRNGLSNMLNQNQGNVVNSDLLDEGYS